MPKSKSSSPSFSNAPAVYPKITSGLFSTPKPATGSSSSPSAKSTGPWPISRPTRTAPTRTATAAGPPTPTARPPEPPEPPRRSAPDPLRPGRRAFRPRHIRQVHLQYAPAAQRHRNRKPVALAPQGYRMLRRTVTATAAVALPRPQQILAPGNQVVQTAFILQF